MRAQNKYGHTELDTGYNLTVPIRCACPSANQTAHLAKYMLTYLVTYGDSIDYMSELFGVDVQNILDANELSLDQVIFPFTPILIPLTAEPKGINTSPAPPPPPAPPMILLPPDASVIRRRSSHKRVFIGIGVGLLLTVTLSGLLIWCLRRRKTRQKQQNVPLPKHSPNTTMISNLPESSLWSVSSEGLRIAIESLTVYKYEELQKATNDFAEENKVKGSVYKGIFNGDYAAVKITKGDVTSEINILKQINHSNIIRLLGFCLHQGNTYLVYEYADNESLTDWLHSTNKNTKYESVLEWKQRVQIALDVADALNYLHNFVNPPYVHKNLKSSNVLLDANMRAKITNFGLARSVDEEKDDGGFQLTRHVVGTFGYMPPEYIENGLITPKMDVFALGVLIAELLSGKEAITRSTESAGDKKNEKEVQLSEMIKEVLAGDNVREKLTSSMDGRLRGEYPLELAYSMAEVASKCVATDLNDRPSVTEVFMTLSKILSSCLEWDPSDELEHSRSLSIGR
nr:protein LYK5 [Tanacetum cinerariifolium]